MVNGVQSCELDLTTPQLIKYTNVRNFAPRKGMSKPLGLHYNK